MNRDRENDANEDVGPGFYLMRLSATESRPVGEGFEPPIESGSDEIGMKESRRSTAGSIISTLPCKEDRWRSALLGNADAVKSPDARPVNVSDVRQMGLRTLL